MSTYLNPSSFGNDFGELFNTAVERLKPYGGILRIEPGLYETETEPLIKNFPRTLKIEATGVNLRTYGPISGIRVESDPESIGRRGTKIIIDGIEIDQAGNPEAVSGIHFDGAWHTKLVNVMLSGDGENSPEWSAVRLNKGANNNLFSLWNKIIDCRIGREFGNGALPHGIRLLDRSNATTISGNTFGSVKTGIAIEAADKVMSNGVIIDSNTCENGGILAHTGNFVELITEVWGTWIKGIQVSNGRYEKMANGLAVREIGAGTFRVMEKGVVLMANQYDDGTVATDNPNSVPIVKVAE